MTYYLLLFILFLAIELSYFYIARKYNIVDKPNERSSHTGSPIRGGGILFWFSCICYAIIHNPQGIYFAVALTLLCVVSFFDDLMSVKKRIRILFHFLAIGVLFFDLRIYSCIPVWAIPLALIVAVGILNAFNFMDGINGMTGLYNLLLLLFLQYINLQLVSFTNPEFIWFAVIPCAIFLFFNYRKQAVCFLGDTGSMAIAIWIIYILLKLMIVTKSLVWILFLSVYGVDTVGTVIYRLYLRKSIFEAHRMFFFQILSNELRIPQRVVSILYAVVNLAVCILITQAYFRSSKAAWVTGGIAVLVLTGIFGLRFCPAIGRRLRTDKFIDG